MSVKTILKLQDQVAYILGKDPSTRNSDKELTICVWREFYPQFVYDNGRFELIKLMNVLNLPSQDGIKRVRAHIQNDLKKYPPTDWKVAQERGWLEEEWKIALGYAVQEEIFR